MTANEALGGAGEGEATQRRRVVRPHATALFWALWFAALAAFVAWSYLT